MRTFVCQGQLSTASCHHPGPGRTCARVASEFLRPSPVRPGLCGRGAGKEMGPWLPGGSCPPSHGEWASQSLLGLLLSPLLLLDWPTVLPWKLESCVPCPSNPLPLPRTLQD